MIQRLKTTNTNAIPVETMSLDKLRATLFTVAYKMTKSAFQSDDIVQEVLLDYTERNPAGVKDVTRYLCKSVIYKCLDYLKIKSTENYVGIDLPEPVTDSFLLTEIRHDISFGILIILSKLNPMERACFVLRECFEFDYSELSDILSIKEDNCRQLLHRAKTKISAAKNPTGSSPGTQVFSNLFMEACQTGDLTKLIGYLKDDITLYPDGGGKVTTALNAIVSKNFVLKYLTGTYEKYGHLLSFRPIMCNGQEAIISIDETRNAVDSLFIIEQENGKISSLYLVRNPDKLKRLDNNWKT